MLLFACRNRVASSDLLDYMQGKVARRTIVCVVQIFRTHIVQIYLEHSFAISRLVYASKIV